MFINFAYGSNMSSQRLRARTPSARPIGIAPLAGHRLMWHKVGRDGSAKCDCLETGDPGDVVWGVLYQIALVDRPRLDLAEGLGQGYEHKAITVTTAAGRMDAGLYVATHIDADLRPFDWYQAFVLHGAREHGLPEHYVQGIAGVGVVVDADSARRATNLAILRGD
jgi:hypothetical protein